MDPLYVPRRRRRPPVACELCRKRKIKCNREAPCSNCIRSKNNAICVYQDLSAQDEHNVSIQTDQASAPSVAPISNASTPSSQPSPGEVRMQLRVKELEEELAKVTLQSFGSRIPSPNYNVNISTTNSHFAGTFHVQSESVTAGQSPTISRTIMHKTRVFGQSHWMNGVAQFAEILEIIEPFLQSEGSNVMSNLYRCKWLGKMIKDQRTPKWPCPPTDDLPSKEITDTLVAQYLRTIETIHRVLHVPSFKQEYEAMMAGQEPDRSFLVLLKLVLAIGAATYDDMFTMRTSAIRWVHEAQTWISEPESKARLGIQFLQIHILLLIARGMIGVDGGSVWVSTGGLIRLAMYMGLHRDPTFLPKMSHYSSEMRRRIWNTILEVELQTSMESGGPPLFSLDDFNTMPPSNFNDEDLTQENEYPVPAPDEIFTDVSVGLAMRTMLPLRLCIAKTLNGMAAHAGYEETLRLDAGLRASYRAVCRQLHGYKVSGGEKAPSDYQMRILDFFHRRYLTALHMPFFTASMKDAKYAYTRKVVVETSLKTWCTVFSSSPVMTSFFENDSSLSEPDVLARLALRGTGPFRTTSTQASFLIAAELKTQLQEESSVGPISLRRDLFSIMEDAKKWGLRCIEAGETNIKGYLFLCLVYAQIEGMMRGLSREEFPEVLLKAAEEAEFACLSILERNIDATLLGSNGPDPTTIDPMSEMMGEWSLMMPDTHFYLGDSGFMDWVTMDSLAASTSYQSGG